MLKPTLKLAAQLANAYDEIRQHAHGPQFVGPAPFDCGEKPLHALGSVSAMREDLLQRILARLQPSGLAAQMIQVAAGLDGLRLLHAQLLIDSALPVRGGFQFELPRLQLLR